MNNVDDKDMMHKYSVGDLARARNEKTAYKIAIIVNISNLNKFGDTMLYNIYECILLGCDVGSARHYYLHSELESNSL